MIVADFQLNFMKNTIDLLIPLKKNSKLEAKIRINLKWIFQAKI